MENVFNVRFVNVGRAYIKVQCSRGRRVSRESVAKFLQKHGMDVSSKVVAEAVAKGTFNTIDREWALFAGRYGGIREVELDGRTVAARVRKLNRAGV